MSEEDSEEVIGLDFQLKADDRGFVIPAVAKSMHAVFRIRPTYQRFIFSNNLGASPCCIPYKCCLAPSPFWPCCFAPQNPIRASNIFILRQ